MKKYFYILCALALLACNKNNVALSPAGFSVSTIKTAYKVGDTVTFNFNGTPEIIVFYSGEIGKRYADANRLSAAGIEKLVFQVSMQQGAVSPLSTTDSLRLYISTNLKSYDAAGIAAANWTDITARNTHWPTSLSTAFTTSDSVNISDFNTAAQVNIAFRATGKKNPALAQRKWEIQNLALSNNLPDGTVTPLFAAPFLGPTAPSASAFAYTGWVEASLKNNNFPGTATNGYVGYNAWNVGTANVNTADSIRNSNGIPIRTAYPITFDPGTTLNNDDNDDWLITTAVDLKTTKPDGGTPIKNAQALTISRYQYVFKKAGTYTVTFVGINSALNNSESVVAQVQLTINP
jgi:hypothetical protein